MLSGAAPAIHAMSPSSSDTPYRAVPSPCIGVCTIDDQGLCHGCHRTLHEIAHWIHMDDEERLRLMDTVLPAREAQRIGGD